ncbi:MAG: deoxyribonuclease IV [Patescibacteria group bacterium]
MPIIGGHVSAEGGVASAVLNARRIGADAIQFFGASPQSWTTRQPTTDNVQRFKEAYVKSGLKAAYLHAAYLVNLASSNDIFYLKSVRSLVDHLKIADALGINGLIFHIGSSKGMSREAALDQEVEGMKKVLKEVPGHTHLLMENTAGGGEKIGAAIEEMEYLFKKVNSERVKVCFDTAHALEAGQIMEYTGEMVKKLFDEWDRAVGLENIEVIHANDSKTAAGSHHDKHENIGQGFIGIDGFRALAGEPRLRDKVWLLEVPGFEDEGPDAKNIELLRSCFI